MIAISLLSIICEGVLIRLIQIVAMITCTILDTIQVLYDNNLSRCDRNIFVVPYYKPYDIIVCVTAVASFGVVIVTLTPSLLLS